MSGLLIALSIAVAFGAGVHCGHRRTIVFRSLYRIKLFFRPDPSAPVPEAAASAFVVEIRNERELRAKRAALIEYLWQGPDMPTSRLPDRIEKGFRSQNYRQFEKYGDLEQWSVNMDFGLDSKVLVVAPLRALQRTAVIYHQGHEGDVVHGAATISYLARRGFYVVALALPLMGPNSQPRIQFKRHGLVSLTSHNYFALLDHEHGERSVRFFIEPVIACINQLQVQGYTSIAMMGCSGGGWTTTLAAALDERISMSFPVAGSLPFTLRGAKEVTDYEQYVPELYEISNYPELHVLGAHAGRLQLQILNEFDSVAWGGRRGKLYEGTVQDTLKRLGGAGRFEVMIDSSTSGHGVSPAALQRIVAEINS